MEVNFSELIGKTIIKINNEKDRIDFYCEDETSIFKNTCLVYSLYHNQDCCESVCVEDINGDLNDLINTPILQAEDAKS